MIRERVRAFFTGLNSRLRQPELALALQGAAGVVCIERLFKGEFLTAAAAFGLLVILIGRGKKR